MVIFLALYTTPTDPQAFDRHYRNVQSPSPNNSPGCAATRSAAT